LTGKDTNLDKRPDVSWHGLQLDKPDWSEDSRVLAFMLDGYELPHEKRDDDFYVILNGDQVEHSFEVSPPKAVASPEDILDEDQGIAVIPERKCSVLPMAAVVFISSSR
jgi:hypothetical protein